MKDEDHEKLKSFFVENIKSLPQSKIEEMADNCLSRKIKAPCRVVGNYPDYPDKWEDVFDKLDNEK